MTASVGESTVTCEQARYFKNLGMMLVVVPISSKGATLNYTPSGALYTSYITINLPEGVEALGTGAAFGGVRNTSCFLGQIVFIGRELRVQVFSTIKEIPYALTVVFDVTVA